MIKMTKKISDKGRDTIQRIVKRNMDPDNCKCVIFGVFSRLAEFRTIPESHREMLKDLPKPMGSPKDELKKVASQFKQEAPQRPQFNLRDMPMASRAIN